MELLIIVVRVWDREDINEFCWINKRVKKKSSVFQSFVWCLHYSCKQGSKLSTACRWSPHERCCNMNQTNQAFIRSTVWNTIKHQDYPRIGLLALKQTESVFTSSPLLPRSLSVYIHMSSPPFALVTTSSINLIGATNK